MQNDFKRPRRNVKSTLVEPFKQVKLGVYVLAITLVFVCIAGYLFVASFMEQYQHVMSIFSVVDPNGQWEVMNNDVFHRNAIRLGALFVSFVVVMLAVVFRMTHRIYGPLVSVERFVNQMANGQYGKRIVIRSGDELQRLVNKLNSMAEELEKRHGQHATTDALLAEEMEEEKEAADEITDGLAS